MEGCAKEIPGALGPDPPAQMEARWKIVTASLQAPAAIPAAHESSQDNRACHPASYAPGGENLANPPDRATPERANLPTRVPTDGREDRLLPEFPISTASGLIPRSMSM